MHKTMEKTAEQEKSEKIYVSAQDLNTESAWS
jgi:hypothetical protein